MPSLTLASLNQPSEENSDSLELDCLKWEAEFSFISYGVRIGVRVNEARMLECLPDYLPPGWEPSTSPDVDQLYSLIGDESNYQLWRDREILAEASLPSVVSGTFRMAGKRGEAAAVAVALLHQLDDWIEDSSDIAPVALTIKPANLPEEKRKEMRSR
ncbi:hypothetical protein [Coleofasciculus chthonoplastes]|uniref:hypothetical protein n=1 Tax=Coleofasciculus TaxID=669368 RepID=UPI0032F13DCA